MAVEPTIGPSRRTWRRRSGRGDRNSVGWRRAQLHAAVLQRLERDWSPQQIAASLRLDFPNEPAMRISHEAIYRSVYLGHGKSMSRLASRHLRTGRMLRQPRLKRPTQGRGRLKNMVSIHQRPAHIEDRLEPGHWESQCCCQAVRARAGGCSENSRSSRSRAHSTSTRRRASAMTACV